MASMEKEFFWGCELSKDKKQYSWDSEDEELSKADIEQKLVLSQACLGAKAKPNERNVVEVTTTDSSNNSVTHTILSLQSGRIDQCRLSLGFPSSVDFKLVEGSGPLHLTGSVYQELYIFEDDDEDSDEDEEPPNLVELEKLTSKKRPLASETPKGPPKKLARVEREEDEDESDDEDESSEESEKMELDTKEKHKKPDTAKAPSNKTEGKDAKVKKAKEESDDEEESDDDEDEEEDEDESDEDESDDDDDEDDDEEDDESDEEDEIADSLTAKKKGGKMERKKPMTNGVTKPGKKLTEEKEKPNKTPTKQPSTPKTGGKKEDAKKAVNKSPEPLSMEQIKEKLKKATSLPKKVDKFKNYMKSTFKMTDETAVTKLWDWLKDSK